MVVTTNLNSNTKSNGKITEVTVNNKLNLIRFFVDIKTRPLGSIALPFEIKKSLPGLTDRVGKKIFPQELNACP